MKPYGGFEANAQNIRIITKLESKSHRYEGLNLTRAVIDGQMKYKNPFDENKGKEDEEQTDQDYKNERKFVYARDLSIVEWAGKEARIAVEGSNEGWKSFECEIMDWADEVAYAVHDLEDSIHAGYINGSTFANDSLSKKIVGKVKKKYGRCVNVPQVWETLINECVLKEYPDFQRLGTNNDHRHQKANRKRLTSYLIGRYIKVTDRVNRGNDPNKPISWRYLYSIRVPIEYRVEVSLIHQLIKDVVIGSPQIQTLEEKGKHIIRSLFAQFARDDNAERLLPEDWKSYLREGDTEENRARVISDYISGMTDDYAQRTYGKLFLPNYGSIYEVL